MKIKITDHRKIHAIQQEFEKVFPYLKLEFFGKPSKAGGKNSSKLIKNESKTLGQCRTLHNKGELTITPAMTVADLEQRFSDVYGLRVHVLRQCGKMWIATSLTENWTLSDQNNQGLALSKNAEQPKRTNLIL